MTFPVAVGHSYRVERSEDLIGWEPAEEFTADQGGLRGFIEALNVEPNTYFRVVALARP